MTLDNKECPICGKGFIKPQSNLYRLKIDGKMVDYCSYTCHNKAKAKYNKGKPKRRGYRG